jgi:hypothetical protein
LFFVWCVLFYGGQEIDWHCYIVVYHRLLSKALLAGFTDVGCHSWASATHSMFLGEHVNPFKCHERDNFNLYTKFKTVQPVYNWTRLNCFLGKTVWSQVETNVKLLLVDIMHRHNWSSCIIVNLLFFQCFLYSWKYSIYNRYYK